MKQYQFLISRRYFRSRMVNIIAVIAVMLGVAALILVTSVMDGFSRDIHAHIRGIMSHVIVESDLMVGIDDYESLIDRIQTVPNVAAVAPLAESPFVLIRANDRTVFGQVRGIDPVREAKTSDIAEHVENLRRVAEEVRFDTPRERVRRMHAQWLAKPETETELFGRRLPNEPPGALIGIELAMQLGGVQRGDRLSITSPTTIMDFETQEVRVVGGVQTGHYEYDSQLMYLELDAAQDLIGLPNRITSISVRLEDRRRKAETLREIERAIRAATPLVSPEQPDTLERVRLSDGEPKTVEDDGGWLRLGAEGERYTRLEIPDAGNLFRQAERATALAFTLRVPDGESFPRIRVSVLADMPMDEQAELVPYRAFDYDIRRPFGAPPHAPGPGLAPIPYHFDPARPMSAWLTVGPGEPLDLVAVLANMETDDHLDLLNPEQTERVVIEVMGGPVDIRAVRFEDFRPVRVVTWRDKQASFLQAVQIERYIQVVIMSLMVVIAGFSIMAILWLMVREKTRDIGVLISLGATRAGIVRIFLLNGLIIGLVGSGLGLLIGWVVSINLNAIEDWIYAVFQWRVFPPDIYYLDQLPHKEDPVTFITMALIAAAVSLVAALWPAIKAARLDPVEALRYE